MAISDKQRKIQADIARIKEEQRQAAIARYGSGGVSKTYSSTASKSQPSTATVVDTTAGISASYEIPKNQRITTVTNEQGQVVGIVDPLAQESYYVPPTTPEAVKASETQRYEQLVKQKIVEDNAKRIKIEADKAQLQQQVRTAQAVSLTGQYTTVPEAERKPMPDTIKEATPAESLAIKQSQTRIAGLARGATPQGFIEQVKKPEQRFGNAYETPREAAERGGATLFGGALVFGAAAGAAGAIPEIISGVGTGVRSITSLNIPQIITGTGKAVAGTYLTTRTIGGAVEVGGTALLPAETKKTLGELPKEERDRIIGIAARASEGRTGKGIVDTKILGFVSPREAAQGLSIFFTDKTAFKEAAEQELIKGGTTQVVAAKRAQALTDYYYKVESARELGQNVALEVSGELVGGGIFTALGKQAKGLSFTAKESFKPLATRAAFSSGISGAAIEGAFGTALQQDIRRQDRDLKQIGLGAALGAGTAATFGAVITGLSLKNPTVSKTALFAGYIADPLEPIGDFIGGRVRRPLGIEEPQLFLRGKTYSFVPAFATTTTTTQAKQQARTLENIVGFSNVPALTPVSTVTPVPSTLFTRQPVPIFANVPSASNIPALTPANIITPANTEVPVPSEQEIPVMTETNVPTETNIPVTTPVIAGGGLIPPFIFGGGGGAAGIGRKSKTGYINELELSRRIFKDSFGYNVPSRSSPPRLRTGKKKAVKTKARPAPKRTAQGYGLNDYRKLVGI